MIRSASSPTPGIMIAPSGGLSADTVVQSPFNPQTLNRYSYCLNNPLKYIDPSGHFTEEELAQLGITQDNTDSYVWSFLLAAEIGEMIVVNDEIYYFYLDPETNEICMGKDENALVNIKSVMLNDEIKIEKLELYHWNPYNNYWFGEGWQGIWNEKIVWRADIDWDRAGQVTLGTLKASIGLLGTIASGWAFVFTDSPLSLAAFDLCINLTVSGWNDVMPNEYDVDPNYIPSIYNYYYP